MRIKINPKYLLLLILSSAVGCASSVHKISASKPEVSPVTIPFTMHDNRILVPVIINGKGPFTFIFDTGGGSTNTITPEAAKQLGLELKKTKDETGVGDQSVSASTAKVAEYSVGPLSLQNQEFEILDLTPIRKAFRFPHLDGIIGFGVLNRTVACLNFDTQNLTVKNGRADCFGTETKAIPFRMKSEMPVISGAINGIASEFVLDTGDRSAFSVCKKFALQSKIDQHFKNSPKVISGLGIGGPVPAQLATLDDIKLGSETHVTHVLSRLPLNNGGFFAKSDLAGSVGDEILRRFNIAIDYSSHEITLVKNSHFDEPYKFIAPFLNAEQSVVSSTFAVGEKDYVFRDSARHRKIKTFVWYPVEANTKMHASPERSPFVPVISAKNAPLLNISQKFPVVLLSHGSGGKADKLFWIANYLVQNGMVVIAVNHPGNMTGDNSASGLMRIWDRPKDLSFALDHVLEKSKFKNSIDTAKVAAMGHSAGGTTALLLGGARLSYGRFTSPIPNCEGSSDDPYYAELCTQMKKINSKSFSQLTVEGDYKDSRVTAVVALDPGFAKSFDPTRLKTMKAEPMVFIAEKLREPQDEIFSKEFIDLLPHKSVEIVPGSLHMTFLSACKPNIPLEGELKALCSDNNQKLKIQSEVAEKSLAFIQKIWAK